MTPLEAARKMAEQEPVYLDRCDTGPSLCLLCSGSEGDHDADCAWIAMPQIVKALEVAERLVSNSPIPMDGDDLCAICGETQTCGRTPRCYTHHAADCDYGALLRALRGDPLPVEAVRT